LQANLDESLLIWKSQTGYSDEAFQSLCTEEKRRAEELHFLCSELESHLKNEIEALYALGLGQSQSKIEGLNQKLDSVLPGLATREQQQSALTQLTESLNTRLEEVLDRLVSAESFEGRLMSSTNMLYEAQNKAITDAVASIRATLETTLTGATSPITQRLGSVMTLPDWERLTRETDQKVAQAVATAVDESLQPIRTELAEIRSTLDSLHAQQDAIRDIPRQVELQLVSAKAQISQMLTEALKRMK
jgi:hypothetical protein